MSSAYEKIVHCYEQCRTKIDFTPKAAIVLGSGLGDFAEHIEVVGEIPYKEIDGFPVSTVAGHAGRYVFGYLDKMPVVLMQGRVHYYEGYSMEEVVLPIRLMRMMGAGILVLTNASGGISTEFEEGDFMLITDHIASFVPSPLIGENIEELGPRFPDMSSVYDSKLKEAIRNAAKENGIVLREGVYVQFTGPNYETPAEVRLAGLLGGDAVGMSTACEAVAARHMGMQVCGISCVVNLAAGIKKTPLSHEEVQAMGQKKSVEFRTLLQESLKKMYEQ